MHHQVRRDDRPADRTVLQPDPTSASYVIGQHYTRYGEPTLTTRKTDGGVYVQDDTYYDAVTRRVTRTTVKPETASGRVSDTNYEYDAAGNITVDRRHAPGRGGRHPVLPL